MTGARIFLPEGLHRRRLVVFHVENGVQLGDLQQVVDLLGQIQQLQFPALVAHGSVCADQFADPRAVDVIHVAEVQQNFLLALAEQVFDIVAQHDAAFAERNAATAIHNGDAVDLACSGFQVHWEASLPPSAVPWTCLVSLISVPAWDGVIFTSSINERIKKIPRPDVFKRFSGASGSGIFAMSKPLPSSRIVITRSSVVRSNSNSTFFAGSYALPCNTAFTAASRTAIAICMTSSSPKPVSDAIRLAVCSALSTVSSVESHL